MESAARLFAGADAEEAASAIGVAVEDVKEWQAASWWPEVVGEGFAAKCFASVEAAVDDGNVAVAMICLERLDPRFAPRSERSHSFANALVVKVSD